MARTDVTGFHSPTTKVHRLGDYNGSTKVNSSTTVNFTGSNAPGAGFIVEDRTNVTITTVDGGEIAGTAVNQKVFYPFGVKTVAIGATGIVYVLHR